MPEMFGALVEQIVPALPDEPAGAGVQRCSGYGRIWCCVHKQRAHAVCDKLRAGDTCSQCQNGGIGKQNRQENGAHKEGVG